MDQSFMKTKKIFPLVLSMALPMALSMLVNSLYNIVDSAFVSNMPDGADKIELRIFAYPQVLQG